MALSLLANPTVQANPAMLAQANTLATQAITLAEQEVAKNVAELPTSSVPQSENIGGTPAVTATTQWIPTGQYEVSNQFALDPNAADEWLNGSNGYTQTKVLATTTFQFTISGRLIGAEKTVVKEEQCNCNDKWFPVAGSPLTITYGDQSQTGTTDSDGVVTLPFHAIGVLGNHQFTYSSPNYTITDYGTVREY